MSFKTRAFAALAAVSWAMPALAEEAAPPPTLNSGDTAWILTSSMFVLMM